MGSLASPPRSVAFSAFRAGSLSSLVLRPSSRSFSGAVLVASFASPARAGAFAGRWARRLGVPVAVRRAAGDLAVSVPVSLRSSRWPRCAGRRLFWSGGLRGFVRALAAGGVLRGC